MNNRTYISANSSLRYDYRFNHSIGEFILVTTYPNGEETIKEVPICKAAGEFKTLESNGMIRK